MRKVENTSKSKGKRVNFESEINDGSLTDRRPIKVNNNRGLIGKRTINEWEAEMFVNKLSGKKEGKIMYNSSNISLNKKKKSYDIICMSNNNNNNNNYNSNNSHYNKRNNLTINTKQCLNNNYLTSNIQKSRKQNMVINNYCKESKTNINYTQNIRRRNYSNNISECNNTCSIRENSGGKINNIFNKEHTTQIHDLNIDLIKPTNKQALIVKNRNIINFGNLINKTNININYMKFSGKAPSSLRNNSNLHLNLNQISNGNHKGNGQILCANSTNNKLKLKYKESLIKEKNGGKYVKEM